MPTKVNPTKEVKCFCGKNTIVNVTPATAYSELTRFVCSCGVVYHIIDFMNGVICYYSACKEVDEKYLEQKNFLMAKTIKLPCYGIEVSLTVDGAGSISSISSDLHGEPDFIDPGDETFDHNNMMHGIESMILGHAIAGIDIETPAYIEGIKSAVEGCANNS